MTSTSNAASWDDFTLAYEAPSVPMGAEKQPRGTKRRAQSPAPSSLPIRSKETKFFHYRPKEAAASPPSTTPTTPCAARTYSFASESHSSSTTAAVRTTAPTTTTNTISAQSPAHPPPSRASSPTPTPTTKGTARPPPPPRRVKFGARRQAVPIQQLTFPRFAIAALSAPGPKEIRAEWEGVLGNLSISPDSPTIPWQPAVWIDGSVNQSVEIEIDGQTVTSWQMVKGKGTTYV
ncbi:hypothetical protein H2203_005794 [Taxawa tesnikishii (nom. ined.)]|nr:hypothetical protein H2203_005794 [Dothideales sp. JES 119]